METVELEYDAPGPGFWWVPDVEMWAEPSATQLCWPPTDFGALPEDER